MDLEDFLNTPANYPGSTLNSELSILKEHISNLRELELLTEKSDYEKLTNLINDVNFEEDVKEHEEGYKSHLMTMTKYKVTDITPRLTYNPITVALWGVLESTINNFCMFAFTMQKPIYKFKEVTGKNLIAKSRKYLNEYLKFNVKYDNYNKLLDIQQIRNYIAHTNGSIRHLPKEKVVVIERLINKQNHVEISHGNIVVSYVAMEEIYNVVSSFLYDLQFTFAERYDYKNFKKTKKLS